MLKTLSMLLLIVIVKAEESKLTSQLAINNENEEIFYKDLLSRFHKQKVFEGILMINEDNKYTYCHNMLKWLRNDEIPVTVITDNKTMEYQNYFNNEILAIACSSAYRYDIVQQLAEILNNMRSTRTIIIMDSWRFAKDLPQLKDYFKYCHEMKMLNVVVIWKNFYKTHQYSQYTVFPEFQLEFGAYQPKSRDFRMLPDRLKDLNGYKLRTMSDHFEPRSMEYYDRNNKTVLVGYLGRFIIAVSEILNATLYFPINVPFGKKLDHRFMLDYVTNYSLDIPISNWIPSEKYDHQVYSYPVEFGKWCFLWPMDERVDTNEIYLMTLHSKVMRIAFGLILVFTFLFFVVYLKSKYYSRRFYGWPEILVNDMAIRGVLGQVYVFRARSQLSVKLIYSTLLLSGLTVPILFGAYLNSVYTDRPLNKEPQTYQELFESDLEIAIHPLDFQYFHTLTNGSQSFLYEKFKIFEFQKFIRLADSFDPHYAYLITSSKMFYFSGLQRYYRKKFFRYSSKLCPSPMTQYAFPLGKNSVFHKRLNELILIIWQSGLLDYWMKRKSFEDVVAAGKVVNFNISRNEDLKPLQVQDLYWIWMYYMVFISVACIVFLLELLIHKRMIKRGCMKIKCNKK